MSSGGLGKGRSGPSLPAYYGSSKNPGSIARAKAKAGPNRSTKASGKLKILPEEPEDVNTTSSIPKEGQSGAKKSSGGGGAAGDDDDDDDDDSSDEDDSGEAVDRFGTPAEKERSRLTNQLALAQIPEGSMRRDARRLTRKGRESLPRVTAFSTATSYRMRELTKWLQARRDTHRTNVMTFDECVYTTYTYELVDEARGLSHHHHHPQNQSHIHGQGHRSNTEESRSSKLRNRSHSTGSAQNEDQVSTTKTGDLLGIPELQGEGGEESIGEEGKRENSQEGRQDSENGTSNNGASTATLVDVGEDGKEEEGANKQESEEAEQRRREEESKRRREEARLRRKERFSVHGMIPEIFFMEYGTIVIWGMSVTEEKRLLRELRKFEVEKLAHEDVESEELNWYLADYSRIYNDVITLRRGSSYMTKLSLSHALAQSTKISFFEGVIDNTIDTTKDIPQSIAESGKIGMPPVDIMKQIGHLFILRMNIHLVGSIVDSPEIFWAQPDLEPLYSAARSYLEIPQRIELLNARVEVLQDMLQLLKDQVTSSHSEWLEIIVIVLILLEIVLGVATMIVDLYFA